MIITEKKLIAITLQLQYTLITFRQNLFFNIFFSISGDLLKEDEILSWLIHQKRHSEIPEVTDEIIDKLIETVPYLAVVFCKFFFLFVVI